MCQGFSHFLGFLHNFVLAKLATSSVRVNQVNCILLDSTLICVLSVAYVNPSNAEATFDQCTGTQKSLKTILTLSYWYSLDSPHRVLSNEYPYARVSVIFPDFCIIMYWPTWPPAA